jgi:hypothetical protein
VPSERGITTGVWQSKQQQQQQQAFGRTALKKKENGKCISLFFPLGSLCLRKGEAHRESCARTFTFLLFLISCLEVLALFAFTR